MQFSQYEESTTNLVPQHEVMTGFSERYLQQVPSSTGKVAYVIFEGREPGLWHNWYVISLFNVECYFCSSYT